MSDDTFDPFKGSSGLADDIDVTFTEVRFVRDPSYVDSDSGDMIPVFAVDFATDDPDVGENGVIENQFLSIGKGWEIEDGGAKVVRPEGKKGGFNNSTYLQSIINTMMDLENGEKLLRGRYEDTGLTPQEAGFWEGLRCHMEQTEYTVGGFGNVEKKTRTRLMPTEVYGWTEAPKPATKAPAKKAPAKKAAVKKAAAKEPEVEETVQTPYAAARLAAGEEIVAQIRAIADECEDTDQFMERCYAEVAGIDESAEIQLLVDDVDSEESIWAEAVEAAS